MAKRVRQKIIIRNMTNSPQILHTKDGDTCLIPPKATVSINEKFTWQKLNPQIFRELTQEQHKNFGMTVHNIRGQHAQIQAMARVRAQRATLHLPIESKIIEGEVFISDPTNSNGTQFTSSSDPIEHE